MTIELCRGRRVRVDSDIDTEALGRILDCVLGRRPIPVGVKVWLSTGHTDMHKGFPSLSLMVQETLRRDPTCGHLFVFRGRGAQLPTFCIRFSLFDDCLSGTRCSERR